MMTAAIFIQLGTEHRMHIAHTRFRAPNEALNHEIELFNIRKSLFPFALWAAD